MLQGSLGIFLLATMLYFSHGYYRSEKKNYQENHELIRWINSNRHHVADNAEYAQRNAGGFLERVNSKANLHSITQERIQPQGEHRLQLWLHDVAFENLMNWLVDLAEENIHVLTVQIDRTDKDGVVNAQCLLTDGTP